MTKPLVQRTLLALSLALALAHPANLSSNAAKTLATITGRDLKNFSALEN